MNFKQLIRKIKYRLGPKELVFDNGPFDKIDMKLLLDRDVSVTICSYNESRGVFIVLVKTVGVIRC